MFSYSLADQIVLKNGTVLDDSYFLGLNENGTARIRRADGKILQIPMSEIRSMTRSDSPAPRVDRRRPRPSGETRRDRSTDRRDDEASRRNAKPPAPLFLQNMQSDPRQPYALGDESESADVSSGVLRWLIPGYARYQAGNEFSGAALFAGFAFSLAATLLYYQSWRDVAARSDTNLAYNLGATGRLDAKFEAARRNTYLSGATFVLFSILHLRDAGGFSDASGAFRESADSNRGVRFLYSFRF